MRDGAGEDARLQSSVNPEGKFEYEQAARL